MMIMIGTVKEDNGVLQQQQHQEQLKEEEEEEAETNSIDLAGSNSSTITACSSSGGGGSDDDEEIRNSQDTIDSAMTSFVCRNMKRTLDDVEEARGLKTPLDDDDANMQLDDGGDKEKTKKTKKEYADEALDVARVVNIHDDVGQYHHHHVGGTTTSMAPGLVDQQDNDENVAPNQQQPVNITQLLSNVPTSTPYVASLDYVSGYEYYQPSYDQTTQALYHHHHQQQQQQQYQEQAVSSSSYANYDGVSTMNTSGDTTSSTASIMAGQYYYQGKTTLLADGSIVYHQPLQPVDLNVNHAGGGGYLHYGNTSTSQYSYEDGMKIMSAAVAESELKNATNSIAPENYSPTAAAEDWARSVICYANGNDQGHQHHHQLENRGEEQLSYDYNAIDSHENEIINVVDVSNDAGDNKENIGHRYTSVDGMSHETMQSINLRYTHQRFPTKLWNLASDENFSPIGWSSDGLSLVIDEVLLEPVLGYFFRSKKYSSFLRQLHLYGFRKVTRARLHRPLGYHNNNNNNNNSQLSIDGASGGGVGGGDVDRYEYIAEYQCNDFQRDRFDLVKNVRRFYQCSNER